MICPPLPPDPLVEHWLARHRHPVSFVLHMIGIPPTILGVLTLPVGLGTMSPSILLLAVALFVGGFLVQFLGHAFEGTDPGEIILIKRKLGLPYVEFAPSKTARKRAA